MLRVLLAMVLLGGAARADDKTVPKADVDQYLAFFDKLVDLVVTDRDRCEQMATDVVAHVDANQALVDKANQAKKDGYALPQDAQDHVHDGVKKMAPGIQHCGRDGKVRAAFDKLGLKKG